MTSREHGSRLFVGGGVVVAVLIAVLSWLLDVSPLRAEAQDMRDETASVETQNAGLQAEATQLQALAEDRDQLVANVRKALNELPPGAQLPGFNRQLAAQARARGVELTSLSIGASATSAPASGQTAGQAAPASALAIPVTVQTTGSLLQQLAFLQDLQQVGPRRALVTSTALAPGVADTSIEVSSTMTVQLTVFSAPLADAVRAQLTGILHPDGAG